MTETTTPTGRAPAKPLPKLDHEKPIWVAIDRAETREYAETFNGWDAEKDCKDWAAERCARLKRDIVIIGPQDSVASPPQNTVGEIKRVKLSPPPQEEAAAPVDAK